MLFKRKTNLSLKNKFKNFFFPTKGILRGYKYIFKRILRINASPYSIALGTTIGIIVALTPLFGLQIILTFILDIIFKANIPASLISSIIGNPITFPFIWLIDYKIGNLFLNINNLDKNNFFITLEKMKIAFINSNWKEFMQYIFDIFLPMLIGSIILGIIIGIPTYIFTYKTIKKYKKDNQK